MSEATASEGEKKAAPAKSNLMLIIIIAVLGTLLIGGGIGGFLLYRSASHAPAAEEASADEAPAEGEAHKSEPKKKEEPAKKGGKKDKEGEKKTALYIPLDPPFVVNFESKQAARFLQITVEVMTRDSATSALLKENNPLLRNDLLLLFGTQEYAVIGTRDGKEILRKDALATVRNVVKAEGGKPDSVEAVYFTSFVMQ